MNPKRNKLRRATNQILGLATVVGLSTQANAAHLAGSLGAVTASSSATSALFATAPFRAFADYGAGINSGWTHAANFHYFQVGSAGDISTGNRFDVSISLQGINFGLNTINPMIHPGFSVWTSGTTPTTNPHGGHEFNQVRGPVGGNAWMTSGNILSGQEGWIGYANAGYAFVNGEGDHVGGLLTPGAGNTSYSTQLSNNDNPAPAANVNPASSWVDGGSATLALGNATLELLGLKAGYYLIGLGGSCPDSNLNGQNCDALEGQSLGYKLTVSNLGASAAAVPIPAAFWLFGGALASLVGGNARKRVLPI